VRDELIPIEQNLKTTPVGFVATDAARIGLTIDGQAVRPAGHRPVHIGAWSCDPSAP
jgi:hypothetical protein